MGLWDDAVSAVKHVYGGSQEAYEDLRNYLPDTIFTGETIIPLKSTLDLAFGTSEQRGSVVEAYAVLLGGGRSTTPAEANTIINTVAPNLKESAVGQLIIPDCFQVSINATNGAQQVCNVIGVRNAGGTALGAANAVKAAWERGTNGFRARLPGQYVINSYRSVDISDPNGDIAVVASTTTGQASTSQATAAACMLIQWNGSTRSRSSRGRLYLGPMLENDVNADGRTVLASSQAYTNGAIVNFLADLAASGYPLVVLSRTLSQAFPVTQGTCESQIATQRRRIRG